MVWFLQLERVQPGLHGDRFEPALHMCNPRRLSSHTTGYPPPLNNYNPHTLILQTKTKQRNTPANRQHGHESS